MRIFFLTTNDRIFLPGFFEKVFSGIDYQITGLAVVDDPHFKRFLKNSLSFMGFWLFMDEIINQLKIRLKDFFFSIFNPVRKSSIKSLCKRYKVPYMSVKNVNSNDFREFLKERDIDVLISVACPQILKRKILRIPRKGCINVHYGLLPNYRGQYPSFWVLAHGQRETGVSVHYMVEKVDAGDILVQIKEKILPEDTFYSLVGRLKTTIGPQALIMALEKINRSENSVIKNDPGKGSYFSFPTRIDMAQFRSRGRKWR